MHEDILLNFNVGHPLYTHTWHLQPKNRNQYKKERAYCSVWYRKEHTCENLTEKITQHSQSFFEQKVEKVDWYFCRKYFTGFKQLQKISTLTTKLRKMYQVVYKSKHFNKAARSNPWAACGPVKDFLRPSLGFRCSKSILYTRGSQTCSMYESHIVKPKLQRVAT